jgi:hydroxyacylglutathione hydrolase
MKYIVCLLLVLLSPMAGAESVSHAFAEKWHDATTGAEPEIQIQHYDADTVIMRQSILTSFEGPFMFLFFGNDKVLLVDSGAGGVMIRPTVEKIIADWLKQKGRTAIPLIVAHTHSHGDHVQGDVEFKDQPNVTVVGHSPEQVAEFFKIANWPEQIVSFDLGGRIIDVIPSPGHQAAEVTYFDRKTRLLLTGDALYPGRLYCTADNFDAYRRSIDRVVDFTKTKQVSWILGNHIEMTRKKRRDYPMQAASHPNEHALELPYSRLLELQSALHHMGDRPELDLHDDFIFYPFP